jgi:hypothetical protein
MVGCKGIEALGCGSGKASLRAMRGVPLEESVFVLGATSWLLDEELIDRQRLRIWEVSGRRKLVMDGFGNVLQISNVVIPSQFTNVSAHSHPRFQD